MTVNLESVFFSLPSSFLFQFLTEIFRNIFTIHEDGIVILKTTRGDQGLYVCEATNGIGSAQTHSFVQIYNPQVSLTTTMESKKTMDSAEATILSIETLKFCLTARVIEEKNELLDEDRGRRIEEITTDQYIPISTMNYLIEAEALTIRVMSCKLSVSAKVRDKSKKSMEKQLIKIIIEEDIIRTRTYLRVVERSATQFWTLQGHTTAAPPYWNQQVIKERIEFEKVFQSDELQKFFEDKNIIERYINILRAKETSKSSEERETRFKLRQVEGQLDSFEKRQLQISKETGNFVEVNDFCTVVHCVANAMHHATEAYLVIITCHRYEATFDIPQVMYRGIAQSNEFEVSIEELVKRQKYFPHSILKLPNFTQSFAIFEEGLYTGICCSVFGIPAPCIRILHNGCPILRNNRSV